MKTNLLIALLFLGIIVMIHELGHFLVAKAVGISAEEFSIGMGPQLLKIAGKETIYSLRLLPIGGYVKFTGDDEDTSDPRAFKNSKIWKRMSVIAAGPIMNFILAVLLFTILFISYGVATDVLPVIDDMIEASAAQEAGLLPGDRFVAIGAVDLAGMDNTQAVSEIQANIAQNEGSPIEMTIERNGEKQEYTITPRFDKGAQKYQLGFYFRQDIEKPGILKALGMSFENTGLLIVNMVDLLGNLIFKGQGAGDVAGPVGIVREIGKAAEAGVEYLLTLGIIITANLGLINLIPFPALDGGRLTLLIFEGIRGKPMNPEKEGYINLVGFVLLMLLMLVVTYKDIFGG
ncbi:MAG TPA: M50 family metallopeptidase [Bacillota bacterium]|nr:M50 family metallopeptidase [Bacillota bacterium]